MEEEFKNNEQIGRKYTEENYIFKPPGL